MPPEYLFPHRPAQGICCFIQHNTIRKIFLPILQNDAKVMQLQCCSLQLKKYRASDTYNK
jgi:hypothetical protein